MLSNQWLQNKSFIQWRLFPSEEDNLYWEKFIQDNPHFQNEIEEAIRILKSIKLNTQKLSPEEKQEIFALIQKNIEKKDKQRHLRLYLTVSAVACIVLFLVLLQPLFIGKNEISHKNMLVVADTTSVNQKDIQLVLANNRTITFEEDADIKYDKKGGITANTGIEQIKVSKEATKETTLNTLIINVVGTQFNVTAYDEDTDYSVVLVEGCVDVSIDKEKARLLPNQMLSVSTDQISVKKIDVNNYISWKEGYLQFASEPLSNILKRLSRYYDTPIDCDNSIAQLKCNGKLVLFDNIEDVMKTIYNTIPIQYSHEAGRILVRKK